MNIEKETKGSNKTQSNAQGAQPLQPVQPVTIGAGGKRNWIFPVETKGKYTALRNICAIALGFVFYAAPWITLPGGAPFLRLSFLSGYFYLFGQPILMYEFYHFVYLALFLATLLFLSSALAGRVWCTYACPQSIFIDRLLRLVEHFIQGPALHRKRLSELPMTAGVFFRKALTQVAFLLISASFGFTLVALFSGPQAVLAMENNGLTVMFVILTLAAYFNGAYWREQFCTIVCPYARFQGVMQDKHTRQIGYDQIRGEVRGKKTLAEGEKRGDCIDCGLCVRVCPTGIDIREGAGQLECVACRKCADACDGIMENLGREKGLIRVDSEAGFNHKPVKQDSRFVLKGHDLRIYFRPRVATYVGFALVLFTYGTHEFLNIKPFVWRVVHTSRDPFSLDGENITNLFTLKIANQSKQKEDYRIEVIEPQRVKIKTPNQLNNLETGAEKSLPVLLEFPMNASAQIASQATGPQEVKIEITAVQSRVKQIFTKRLVAPAGQQSTQP